MRYLYPRSTKHLKYGSSIKLTTLIPYLVFSFLLKSKKVNFCTKLYSFYVKTALKDFYIPNFNPKTVCWINSRARWVIKDFHFSRGVLKVLFTSGQISGFKPNAW